MITFKEFKLNENKNGVYIGMRLSSDSKKLIQDFINENDIQNPVPLSDLHVTLIYSEVYANGIDSKDKLDSVGGVSKGFSLFGEDKNVLVLEVESEGLTERHNEYMEQFPELKWSWPDYKPHVTLSYDVGSDFDLSILPPFKDKIIFVDEYVEDLDPNY